MKNRLIVIVGFLCIGVSISAAVDAPVKNQPGSMLDLIGSATHDLLPLAKEIQEEGALHRQGLEEKKQKLESEIETKVADLERVHDDNHKKQVNRLIEIKQAELARLNREIDTMQKNGQMVLGTVNAVITQATSAVLEIEKKKEERKTDVAKVAVEKQIEQDGSLKRLEYLLQQDNLTRLGGFAVLTSCGIFAGYYGAGVLFRWVEKWMTDVPSLVRESSFRGPFGSMLLFVRESVLGYKPQPVVFDDVVLNPEIDELLKTFAKTTKLSRRKGIPYRHLLLYGPPGVGKTMYARRLAQFADMDYAIISGNRMNGAAVHELHKLFDWAELSSRGIILFFDEVDATLEKRPENVIAGNGPRPAPNELLTAFLERTGAPSTKFMLMLATNREKVLDEAVRNRITLSIKVPLPGPVERIKLFDIYFKKYVLDRSKGIIVDKAIDKAFLDEAAKKLEGMSGREIEQIAIGCQAEATVAPESTLTPALFNKIVEHKIHEKVAIAG